MRKHDYYKIIVWSTVFCAGLFFLAGRVKAYWEEERLYGFSIQSERDLTAEIAAEFSKLAGMIKFEPKEAVSVTISLDSYAMEAVLTGVEFQSTVMRFSSAEQNVMLGNVPKLLVGEEVFSFFTDKNGNTPFKSQTDKWKENYRSLVLTVTDGNGVERKGKISGIVKQDNHIYMDKQQMYKVFGKEVHTMGGYMEIYGYKNTKKAKKLLEQAGFLTEDTGSVFMY